MMTKLPLHSRVALKDGVDHVYVYALAGTEGWVRGFKQDDDGFDLVRIEWDKEHWRYNGQPDGWTFADHFYVIGSPMPPRKVEETEDEQAMPDMGDGPLSLADMTSDEPDPDRYMEILTEAMDTASESEGFLMFTIRRQSNPENESEVMFIPQIFTNATSKEAGMLLDIQLAEAAAMSYQEMVFTLIQAIKNDQSS